jgi:hypothetical protein
MFPLSPDRNDILFFFFFKKRKDLVESRNDLAKKHTKLPLLKTKIEPSLIPIKKTAISNETAVFKY